MITMNTLAIVLPIGGKTTGELSDMYPNLFVPAGFTFSIWSVIYILLIGMIVYQWVYDEDKSKLKQIGPYLFLNTLFNGLWILAWHYLYIGLSLVIMLGLLGTLMMLYKKMNINYPAKQKIQWFVDVPISVYLGWISVATIANVTTLCVHLGWSGGPISQDVWASIMIIVAVALGLLMLKTKRDIFYGAVIAWAVYGIFSKRTSVDVANMTDAAVEHTSQIGLFIMIIGLALTLVLTTVYRPTNKNH